LLVTDKYCNLNSGAWERLGVQNRQELIISFAIACLQDDNIARLFIRPEYEQIKIGKQLYQIIIGWYFTHSKEKLWLNT
jgi:hypothetical protein